MTLRRILPRTLPFASLLLAATAAQAHPGHPHPYDEVDEFEVPGTLEAVMHPFTGLDHLVAALAVGCLAYAMGRKMGGFAAALFMGVLTLGWALGRMGLALPMLEQGLALTIIGVGVVLALGAKTGTFVRMGLVALMAFWHGSAHGMEMPGVIPGSGLIAGTGIVVALGAMFSALTSKLSPAMPRFAGAAAALVGLVIIVQRLG